MPDAPDIHHSGLIKRVVTCPACRLPVGADRRRQRDFRTLDEALRPDSDNEQLSRRRQQKPLCLKQTLSKGLTLSGGVSCGPMAPVTHSFRPTAAFAVVRRRIIRATRSVCSVCAACADGWRT